jgi:hypothetical protein
MEHGDCGHSCLKLLSPRSNGILLPEPASLTNLEGFLSDAHYLLVALFSSHIFERDNADHSPFTSQHGQLAEIFCTHQLFSFSDGLVLKAIERFLIQIRLSEFNLRIVTKTPTLRLSSLSDTVPSSWPSLSVTGDEVVPSDRNSLQVSCTEAFGRKVFASTCTISLSVLGARPSAWSMADSVFITA